MDEVLYTCRFVQFTAALVMFGALAFRLYAVPGGDAGTAPSVLAEFDAWLGRITRATAIVALVSALALLLCQTAAMAGSPAAATDPVTVTAVLFETRFGRIWLCHLLLAIFLVLACLGRPHRRQRVVLILSLPLLASLGWIGHAAMDEGVARIGHELNQTVHLLAAGLWLGGLVPLGWLLRRARTAQDDAGIIVTRDAIRHFSQMGYVAVALIALTGTINTLLLVGSLGAMFGTPYGRLLALKILLFLAMVAVALINRFRLLPRLCREPQPSAPIAALARSVLFEQGLGFAVLAVVSVLGTWPPGIHHHKVEDQAVSPVLPSMWLGFHTGPQEAVVFGRNELA
jgi:copper resistance protein D